MLYALIMHLCALSQPVTAINDSLLCTHINKKGIELLNTKTGKLVTINSATLEKLVVGDTMATVNSSINHVRVTEPAFWLTAWFIIVCVVLPVGLLFAFYRYRVNQFIHLQQVRNRIATDLHDDIGSALTNISILSELSRKYLLQKDQAGVFLDRIKEEVANSGQALDDIVWSINAKNDTLEQTVVRMRRYVAELFDAANITYSLQLDEQFEQYKLNMEQRRDCFLIFKESINNIYKHACAQHVHIKVWIDKSHLFMTIKDDGKGFDITAATHGNGIKNIRNRIQKWKGSLTINSVGGKGTVTEVAMPMRSSA